MAELLTVMYDASLDKLSKHQWSIPGKAPLLTLYSGWTDAINFETSSNDEILLHAISSQLKTPSLWWLNPLDHAYGYFHQASLARNEEEPILNYGLLGRVSGVSVTNAHGLSEVVVVGYSTRRRDLTGSVAYLQIRGTSSIKMASQELIVLDGLIYEGDYSKIDINLIKDAVVLKGADATSIYGSRASKGALVLSTKGKIMIPGLTEELPVPKIRKNFSETAFFFPAIYADRDGYYKFTFTMPESVTEWNWKLFAHTKTAEFAYAERKIVSQLPMMVQPHMPRLLYRGDRILLQSRLSNLDTLEAIGKINIKVEDLGSGMDITKQIAPTNERDFKLDKKSNSSIGFELKIPTSQLNPIRIKITARSPNFADGEEHVIPILSPKIFVRSSKQFHFTKQDTTIQSPLIPADAEFYGIGLSINPKPQTALFNSLPYLANFPYSCAEQIFNRIFAYAIANKIIQTDPEARQSYAEAKAKIQDTTAENLPDQLQEQTMPWLNLSHQTTRIQSQLLELFDTVKTQAKSLELLTRIYKLQNPDGGISWFDGGKSNDHISSYLLRGFGEMERLQYLTETPESDFIDALHKYCQSRILSQLKTPGSRNNVLQHVYALSFWNTSYAMNDSIKNALTNWINEQWKIAFELPLQAQALLIIASLRYSDKGAEINKKAIAHLQSLRQLAIIDEQNGIRWKDIADADDLNSSSEETIALIAEAFEEGGFGSEINPGIIKWLLTAREEHRWSTTKATAAAIGRIQKEKKSIVGPAQTISIESQKAVAVTDDNLRGNSFAFATMSNNQKEWVVEKEATLPAKGSISWYYFSSVAAGDPTASVKLKKKLLFYDKDKNSWIEIGPSTVLKIGDKIKTELTIDAEKALRFVFIDDKRAAAFEPAKIESGYSYFEGVGYYLSVRDAGMQIFAEFIPSGKSTLSYEWTVSQEGEFHNGPASLQCMYKPAMNAYSNGMLVRTSK